jgi:hypothetical protein
MATRGGARIRAGRKAGGKNRTTIERAVLAQRIIEEAEGKPGRKLGKEMLEEFAIMFGGLAASFQPVGTGRNGVVTKADLQKWTAGKDEPMFHKYATLAAKCASDLADFQSPRFARVQIAAPPPTPQGPVIKKFTFSIFDHNGRPAPRSIDVKNAKSADPPEDLSD